MPLMSISVWPPMVSQPPTSRTLGSLRPLTRLLDDLIAISRLAKLKLKSYMRPASAPVGAAAGAPVEAADSPSWPASRTSVDFARDSRFGTTWQRPTANCDGTQNAITTRGDMASMCAAIS